MILQKKSLHVIFNAVWTLTKKTFDNVTLQEALHFFGNLRTERTKKFEIKVFDKYIYILS